MQTLNFSRYNESTNKMIGNFNSTRAIGDMFLCFFHFLFLRLEFLNGFLLEIRMVQAFDGWWSFAWIKCEHLLKMNEIGLESIDCGEAWVSLTISRSLAYSSNSGHKSIGRFCKRCGNVSRGTDISSGH